MTDDFGELGRLIRHRREQLGLSYTRVQAAGGPSVVTMRKIEDGEPVRRRIETTYALEQILGWPVGSINGFLDFGTVPQAVREPERVADGSVLQGLPTALLEAELARRRAGA